MDLGLKGKRAIVTGGTRGIGRAIAETLAGEGAAVAICARKQDEIDEAVAALKSKQINAFGGVADIADADALKAWVGKAISQLGGLDVIVCNASGFGSGNTEQAWAQGFAVDIMGAQRAIGAAMPELEKSAAATGDACAIIISSISAAETSNANAYGAVKAAQIHYAKGLAKEKAAKHVRVNVVSPGTVYFAGGVWGRMETAAPQVFKNALGRNPMGRMASPQDIANAAVFLASPASSFTTGVNLVVDGAYTNRVNF